MTAKKYPYLKVNVISPGFISTNMTSRFVGLKAELGTVSIRHCLFAELEGNGRMYGSDGLRSPLHKTRNPGTPEY
jgi:hypothetical protein